MPAKKAKTRTTPPKGPAKADDPEAAPSTQAAPSRTDAAGRPAAATGPPAGRAFGIVLAALAGLALAAGIAILSLAVYTYENVNMAGTFTVDQQIQMATGGIIAGTGLAVAGLVTLGLAFVGFRRP